MAKSIEYYTAEVSKSYDNSKKALQNQINAIEGNLAKTQSQINENYAQQQNTLNNQRNQAASSASMQAAGSGGSFGGAANIANKKFYEQTYVPAQTQLNTNQSQALENAQSQADTNRLSLEGQLANLNDQIARTGLQRYYDVLNQEREDAYRKQQLALQKKQLAAQNAAAKYYAAAANAGNKANGATVKSWNFGNGYSLKKGNNGEAIYVKDGKQISAGRFLEGTGASGAKWDVWKDVWKNGVSTDWVGSDTIEAFNRKSPTGYGYLY